MGFAFMEDLDGYFCEKYANYDRLCVLKGYEMPKMQSRPLHFRHSFYSVKFPRKSPAAF